MIYDYIYLVLNVVFIPRYIVKGVQDDLPSKTYDCVTLYISRIYREILKIQLTDPLGQKS